MLDTLLAKQRGRAIETLNRFVPWHRLPKWLGLANLAELRKILRAENLYDANAVDADNGDVGGLFVIGNHKVMPNVSGVYKKGQDVGIYLQVYNAGTDQTTLKPDIDVDYILLRDGKELSRTHEDWSGLSDSSQRLVLAKLLPTSTAAPGEYEVIVSIRDRVSPQKIESRAKFSIIR